MISDCLQASVTLRQTLDGTVMGGRMSRPLRAIKPDGSRCGAYPHGDSEFCSFTTPPSSGSAQKDT